MISYNKLKIVNNLRIKNVPVFNFLSKFKVGIQQNACDSHTESLYKKDYANSISDPVNYWKSKVDLVEWYDKPKRILDRSNTPFDRW